MFGEDYTIWGDTLDRDLLLRARGQKRIACHCGKSLTFVDAIDKIPHFRHLKGNCRIVGEERDTETHREGLEFLGQQLRKTIDGIVEKERTFKVSGRLRRTDIFVTLKDRTTICYELQCSPIRKSEFRSRTAAYNGLGQRGYLDFWTRCKWDIPEDLLHNACGRLNDCREEAGLLGS